MLELSSLLVEPSSSRMHLSSASFFLQSIPSRPRPAPIRLQSSSRERDTAETEPLQGLGDSIHFLSFPRDLDS